MDLGPRCDLTWLEFFFLLLIGYLDQFVLISTNLIGAKINNYVSF